MPSNYDIHACIVLFICLFITASLFVSLLVNLGEARNSAFVKCALLSIFFSILFMIQKICLWFYSSITSGTSNFDYNICWIVPFTNQYLGFAKIFLYLYFILRLHKLFHRSAMAISKKKLVIFAFSMIFILTISIMLCIYIYMLRNTYNFSVLFFFEKK